jgi:2'-5' RNA ligase
MKQLIDNAVEGRGLWIGLLLEESQPLKVFPRPLTDPHVTLVHMGKVNDRVRVLAAMSSAYRAASEMVGPLVAKVSGYSRFCGSPAEGDPVVVLLNSVALRVTRDRMLERLRDLGAEAHQHFDYTPHVTMGRHPQGDHLTLESPVRLSLAFDRIAVTCGEARMSLPLVAP